MAAIPGAMGGIEYEIVLVDNGSDPDQADTFYSGLSGQKNITVIRSKKNGGFPAACNFGSKRTRSPILFFLNSDVVLDSGSVELLVDAIDDPAVGIVGMKLVFPEDAGDLNAQIRPAGKIQHVGISVSISGEVHHLFIGWDEYHPRVMRQSEVFAVTGAALMVRRVVWNRVGGFFEGYGLGTWEDIDLCVSARSLGFDVRVVPAARGVHYTGATAESHRIAYPLQQNRFTFLQRHAKELEWWDGILL